MTDTLLVRLKPHDPRRGFVLRRFNVRRHPLPDEWAGTASSARSASTWRAVRTVPTDKYALLAFDVCTEAEAKALDAARERGGEGQETPPTTRQVTTARSNRHDRRPAENIAWLPRRRPRATTTGSKRGKRERE